MPGLCPVCGKVYCDHTAGERGQTSEEMTEDLDREMTPEEIKALGSLDPEKKLSVAQRITREKNNGIFEPKI